jgi:HK97 family phage major capsid protein
MTEVTLAEIASAFRETKSTLETLEDRLLQAERRADLAETRAARPGVMMSGLVMEPGARGFNPGHQVHTVPAEQKQHVDAFTAWLRNPMSNQTRARLFEAEAAALSPNETRIASGLTGQDGGHLVPAVVATNIAQRITNISPIRSIARVTPITSTLTKFPLDRAGTGTGWVGENAARPGTTEPILDLRTPTYGTVYGLLQATEEILMDSAIDIQTWLTSSAATAIASAEGAAFVSGNGTNRPTGFLAGPTPVVTADASRASGTLQYVPGGAVSSITSVDGLVNLFYSLKAAHRTNGTWLMNSATASVLALLKDTTGRLLWSPALAEGTPATLLGRPVVIAEDMPAIAANAFPVAFGDFNEGYLIADQGTLRITVDDNITTPGLVKYYVRRRTGGIIYNSEAIKLLRVSTT